MKRNWFRRCLWVACFTGSTLFAAAILHVIFSGPPRCSNIRLTWSCLMWSNVGVFEARLRAELPLGTSAQAAEAYLQREGIPFSYRPPFRASDRRFMWIGRNMTPDWGGDPNGSLRISIFFDKDDGIREIHVLPHTKAPLPPGT